MIDSVSQLWEKPKNQQTQPFQLLNIRRMFDVPWHKIQSIDIYGAYAIDHSQN